MVGIVGQILGDQQINIAGMHLCRNSKGGLALIVLTVDSRLPPDVLTEITGAIGAVVAGQPISTRRRAGGTASGSLHRRRRYRSRGGR